MSQPMNDPQDPPEETGYDLVMPFVTCASVGGPHDDQSFVAGYQVGQADMALQTCATLGGTSMELHMVHSELLPQLEFIAMRHGFVMEADDTADGWSSVTFRSRVS